MHLYTLETLPPKAQENILKSFVVKNRAVHRRTVLNDKFINGTPNTLFSMGAKPAELPEPQIKETSVIWATDNYSDRGAKFSHPIKKEFFSYIIPRVEKAKEEQKRRTKEKAEVFTPSWVCNLQNNLIDDELLYPNAFNTVDTHDQKIWHPTESPVEFTEDYTWINYITERKLEMCCGEGPYLFSPYDTTTGSELSVRNSENRFQRIGILDRKLRIVTENSPKDIWAQAAIYALQATYGSEWSGDNLLLARLNMINTYCEYYFDALQEVAPEELVIQVSEIAAWNIWQSDSLKQVMPETCTNKCPACEKKKRAGHDGLVSVIKFGGRLKSFEEFLPVESF